MKEFWASLSLWKKIKLVISLIIAAYVVLFAFINWQETEINFLLFKIKISLTLLILVCLLCGYLISTIFDYKKYRVKNLEIEKLKSQLEKLEGKD